MNEKRVDEAWKERADRERQLGRQDRGQTSLQPEQTRSAQQPSPSEPPSRGKGRSAGGDFGLFLSSLSMQALMALGEVAHPATGQPQEDLEQARYLIDVLSLLQEKTKGNLTSEEAALLDGALYELRMKYVARMEKKA